ncbi:MAG: fibrobacter succinogenes major paralogous domain-containing protein [Bacteroidales bacterium]|jgi:uncharacterized protein (TIGR02145 family)
MKIRFWLNPFIIIMGIVLILMSSCKKTDDNKNSSGNITDQDGNVYTSVIIGTQTWIDENLKTTKYNNGDIIGTTTPATLDISNEITPKYQWAYNGDESSVASYGRLYTWYSVTDSRGVCPTGWHVPTDAEWKTLEIDLGMTQAQADGTDWRGTDQGTELKSTTRWQNNGNGTNSSGFNAVGCGSRDLTSDPFHGVSFWGNYWTTTPTDATSAWAHSVSYNFSGIYRYNWNKGYGLSVRCIKDKPKGK